MATRMHALVLAAVADIAMTMKQPPQGYHPVVFTSPFVGYPMDVKNSYSWTCTTSHMWIRAWLPINSIAGLTYLETHPPECYEEFLGLNGFDIDTNRSVPRAGVQVRPCTGWDCTIMMMGGLYSNFEHAGYRRGTHMAGHSYDWRLSVEDWQHTSFPELKKMTEDLVQKAGGSKAVFTGISMAGPYTHRFFTWVRTVDKTWTDRYVHAFVPLAGPWNGAVNALLGTVSLSSSLDTITGYCPNCKPKPVNRDSSYSTIRRWYEWLIGNKVAKKIDEALGRSVNTWPAMYWMSTGVDASTQPPTDEPVIEVQQGEVAEYKPSDLPTMYEKMGRMLGKRMYEYAQTVPTTDDPGVPTHCIFGYNVQTESKLIFTGGAKGASFASTKVILDDGDSVVNIKSLEVCTRWKSTVKVYKIPGLLHSGGALSCKQVADVLLAIAMNNDDEWKKWKEPTYKEVSAPHYKASIDTLFDKTLADASDDDDHVSARIVV